MKICVLESSYQNSTSCLKYVERCNEIASYFNQTLPQHEFHQVFIDKAQAAQEIGGLSTAGYDVFINLCYGSWDTDIAGMEVVELLEAYNLPFTGANSAFYEPSKELQKVVANRRSVPTPKYIFAFKDEDVEVAHTVLKYPMIVKHYNGYCSIGMTSKSRVTCRVELYEMAQFTIRKYGGALIEEFIEGQEFAVLVVENPDDELSPIVLTPIECLFHEGETFKHFDVKFYGLNTTSWTLCTNTSLALRLQEYAKTMFVALGGVGYGRADFRVNSNGEVFFLEMNPNCSVFSKLPGDNTIWCSAADIILQRESFSPLPVATRPKVKGPGAIPVVLSCTGRSLTLWPGQKVLHLVQLQFASLILSVGYHNK